MARRVHTDLLAVRQVLTDLQVVHQADASVVFVAFAVHAEAVADQAATTPAVVALAVLTAVHPVVTTTKPDEGDSSLNSSKRTFASVQLESALCATLCVAQKFDSEPVIGCRFAVFMDADDSVL